MDTKTYDHVYSLYHLVKWIEFKYLGAQMVFVMWIMPANIYYIKNSKIIDYFLSLTLKFIVYCFNFLVMESRTIDS